MMFGTKNFTDKLVICLNCPARHVPEGEDYNAFQYVSLPIARDKTIASVLDFGVLSLRHWIEGGDLIVGLKHKKQVTIGW